MGTRADFYVGRGESAEWIGSITWDGYPEGINDAVFTATTEEDYRAAVKAFFDQRNDVTHPTEPWPWPWNDSATTDYAYAFEATTDYAYVEAAGEVFGSCFGHTWFRVDPAAEDYGQIKADVKDAVFPDMSSRKGSWDHIMGRSGLITFGPQGVSSPNTFGLSDPATVDSAGDGD